MPKLTNVRERVHQPFRDTLVRSAGYTTGSVTDVTRLFTVAGKPEGETNLPNGSTLPSDQSMVVLACRVFTHFRNSIQRPQAATGALSTRTVFGAVTIPAGNGDYVLPQNATDAATFASLLGTNGVGAPEDCFRLWWQSQDQLLWSFGAGDKYSITSMPTAYFPYGGGLAQGQMRQTELIQWSNGMPSHEGILRLARAVLIPPRQNIKCDAQISPLDAGQNATVLGSVQGSRNMLSLRDNLNALDLVNKVISFTFDGLFSRDVQ
jgi:hypothetical protein